MGKASVGGLLHRVLTNGAGLTICRTQTDVKRNVTEKLPYEEKKYLPRKKYNMHIYIYIKYFFLSKKKKSELIRFI